MSARRKGSERRVGRSSILSSSLSLCMFKEFSIFSKCLGGNYLGLVPCRVWEEERERIPIFVKVCRSMCVRLPTCECVCLLTEQTQGGCVVHK